MTAAQNCSRRNAYSSRCVGTSFSSAICLSTNWLAKLESKVSAKQIGHIEAVFANWAVARVQQRSMQAKRSPKAAKGKPREDLIGLIIFDAEHCRTYTIGNHVGNNQLFRAFNVHFYQVDMFMSQFSR